LGLSRTYAYDLAKRGEFPCEVLRIGTSYRVPTMRLLALLGVDAGKDMTASPSHR
jgi:Helix-turn-helix domain